MKITAKIDYACKALLELGMHWPNQSPVQVHTIAQRQKIPEKFLTHILINLKQLGYVSSVRGKSGGYLLAVEPKNIKLSDIVQNIDGAGAFAPDQAKQQNQNHVFASIWKEIDQAVLQAMEKVDFEKICQRKRSKDNVVMFEI